MPEKQISFVIPHRGPESLLAQTLQSIADQHFDLARLEVLVVTQNESLSGVIARFDRRFDLEIYTQPEEHSISQLRNHGVLRSNGDYLAFVDADIRLSPDWLPCMIEELEKPGADRVLVSSVQANSEQAGPVERIRTALSNLRRDSYVDALHGSNLFLRRETFERVGGFPEELRTCEDVYFTSQVGRFGKIYHTSAVSHVHLGEDQDYSSLFRKEIWRGQSNLHSLAGRGMSLRELPSIVIPLAIMLLPIAGMVLLYLGYPLLSLLAIIMLLIPAIAYTIRLKACQSNRAPEFVDTFKFYLIYFFARGTGTYLGLLRLMR